MKRRRGLTEEEAALWEQVKRTAQPLHREPAADLRRAAPIAAPVPKHRAARTAIPDFALGEKAAPRAPVHDLAPGISERLDAAPLAMDRRRFGKLKKGRLTPEARLDLHGMTLDRAHGALGGFIRRAHADGKRLVLVITGKGRTARDDEGPIPVRPGVLRHQVPAWLQAPPLSAMVLQVTQAHRRHGGEGALYVYLRRGGR